MSSYEDELKADIEEAVHKLHVQDEARRLYSAASARIEPVALSNRWPRPEGVEYLITGLAPADGYILIPAERKAGKSTLVLNIIRALITVREPFLGEFRVHGRPNVAYFDMEMGWDRVSRWFDKAGLERGGKLYAESLRGRARAFDVLDDKVRGDLAMQMSDNGIGVLFTDPLGPLLRSYNVDERDNTGVGRVIDAFLALKEEAGIHALFTTHHKGKDLSRGSRGASVLEDTPDAIWHLDKDDRSGMRTLRAYGRDVDEVQELEFDRDTLSLTAIGEGQVFVTPENKAALIAAVESGNGLSSRQVWEIARKHGYTSRQNDVTNDLFSLERHGLVSFTGPERRPKWRRPMF